MAADVDVGKFGFEDKDARLHDTLEYLLVVAHRESGEFFRYDQKVEMKLRPETRDRLSRTWYGVVKDFELAPGGYQAKIVVRDKNTGKIGTVVHEFGCRPEAVPGPPPRCDRRRAAVRTRNRTSRGPLILARRTFGTGAHALRLVRGPMARPRQETGMPVVTPAT